jgi:hypothetical protein
VRIYGRDLLAGACRIYFDGVSFKGSSDVRPLAGKAVEFTLVSCQSVSLIALNEYVLGTVPHTHLRAFRRIHAGIHVMSRAAMVVGNQPGKYSRPWARLSCRRHRLPTIGNRECDCNTGEKNGQAQSHHQRRSNTKRYQSKPGTAVAHIFLAALSCNFVATLVISLVNVSS